jgi:ADP-heptose:LPS heptosyltransferase
MDHYRAQACRMTRAADRILVIKLGALGNVILSLGPFATIRRHHAGAHITLLTTAPYADWLATSPYFDQVWVDERPEWWNAASVLRLRRRLIGGRFDRVYDLQTSSRSSHYFHLFRRVARPDWSGIAFGCSLPDRDPDRNQVHDIDRQFGQLRAAGIAERGAADLSWCQGDIGRFGLPRRLALLAPGSSPHRTAKRWPITHYRDLAKDLLARGVTPVVIGTAPEGGLAQSIQGVAPATIDLTGRTGFADIASLARASHVAIGNDTGPMHLIAAAGCPSIVLFSGESDPALCAPRGPRVTVLRRPDLAALEVDAVRQVMDEAVPAVGGALVGD